MVGTLVVLYVLIGFLFSVGMWDAYNSDNSPEKHADKPVDNPSTED